MQSSSGSSSAFWLIHSRQSSNLVRFMSQRFTVARINGTTVCEIEARLDGHCVDLKDQISEVTGLCKCKFRLLAGTHEVRDGFYVKRILKFIEPAFVLQLVEQPIVRTDFKDLLASGVCLKCMREVGVEAHEILDRENGLYQFMGCMKDIAAAMRLTGFSLKEVRRAADQLRLATHPHVTRRTLFDSQLKAAGFTAGDFKEAGCGAHQLSKKFFWRHEDLSYGEVEREPCSAFFTASDLRSAGYDAYELYMARFSIQDLKEAGFGVEVEELHTILIGAESLRHVQ